MTHLASVAWRHCWPQRRGGRAIWCISRLSRANAGRGRGQRAQPERTLPSAAPAQRTSPATPGAAAGRCTAAAAPSDPTGACARQCRPRARAGRSAWAHAAQRCAHVTHLASAARVLHYGARCVAPGRALSPHRARTRRRARDAPARRAAAPPLLLGVCRRVRSAPPPRRRDARRRPFAKQPRAKAATTRLRTRARSWAQAVRVAVANPVGAHHLLTQRSTQPYVKCICPDDPREYTVSITVHTCVDEL